MKLPILFEGRNIFINVGEYCNDWHGKLFVIVFLFFQFAGKLYQIIHDPTIKILVYGQIHVHVVYAFVYYLFYLYVFGTSNILLQ